MKIAFKKTHMIKIIIKNTTKLSKTTMENIVFITTTMVCVLIAFALDQISCINCIIQKYYNLEIALRSQHEHIIKCILYTPVQISQPLRRITITQSIEFQDIYISDGNKEKIPFKINREKKIYYSKSNGSSHPQNSKDILIEFDCPVIFKYIEFVNIVSMVHKEAEAEIILLHGDTETKVFITKEKHIICNTEYIKNV